MRDSQQHTAVSAPPVIARAPSGRRAAASALSWGAALAFSFGLLLYCLSQIAAGGPPGGHQAAALHADPRAYSGAIALTLGSAPRVTARTAFVYDPTLGFVYYSKNADLQLPMASCTKIMTALLAVERGNLDQMVTIGADAAALATPGNSYMGVSQGERISLGDLLYGLLLPSGNDAAIAIADAIGGNVPNFVALMNARAQQLGLTHTHFANPHGLDAPGHYTTARDLATLAAVAMRNPALVKITSTHKFVIAKTATHKQFVLYSGDDLVAGARSPYPGAIGVKPGFTGDAGYCQAFAAIRHGHLIVGAVLGEPDWNIRLDDMRNLLDWGFEEENIPPPPAPVAYSYPTPEP
ncbi:MAG: D-alanyl-D-alanine carboxypeptidase family protein [Ktedonobacterales bacterium]